MLPARRGEPAAPGIGPEAVKLIAGALRDRATARTHWRVVNSTGDRTRGHVFVNHVGQVAEIRGSVLLLPDDTPGRWVSKQLRELSPRGDRVAFDLRHHRYFASGELPETDPVAGGTDSKGWHRVGLARVDGDTLSLALDFTAQSTPTSFETTGTVEVVTLERVKR